jgi:ParB/RepB/Spo0J family partition protein
MSEVRRYRTSELQEMANSGAVYEIPHQLIKPFKGQPRRHFDGAKLARLKQSIKERGQNTAGEVRILIGGTDRQFELVDGERRLRACQLLDRPFRALVIDIDNAEEQFEKSILANFNRADHTPLEIAHAVSRIRRSARITTFPKGEQIDAVARTFGHSTAWVHSYLSLERLEPQLRKLLEPEVKKSERIPLRLAFRLATLPKADQLPEWESIRKKKLSHREAQRHIDTTIIKKGLGVHRRGRKPSDDMEIFARFLGRIEKEAASIMDMPDAEFHSMFTNRNTPQRKRIMDDLEMMMQSLERVRQRTEAAMRAVPPRPMVS